MRVLNVHARELPVEPAAVAPLLDSLSSPGDRLWPRDRWPPMRFDRPLQPGAAGGHGPIRYVVESYVPGSAVAFRFTAPRGFRGTHAFTIERSARGCRLTHTLEMTAQGLARISWPLVFRPLHDALVEDGLDRAAAAVGAPLEAPPWSAWVRALRRLLGRRRGKRAAR